MHCKDEIDFEGKDLILKSAYECLCHILNLFLSFLSNIRVLITLKGDIFKIETADYWQKIFFVLEINLNLTKSEHYNYQLKVLNLQVKYLFYSFALKQMHHCTSNILNVSTLQTSNTTIYATSSNIHFRIQKEGGKVLEVIKIH